MKCSENIFDHELQHRNLGLPGIRSALLNSYRHGPFYSTVPAWFFLQNCTGMVLSTVLYRPDPFDSIVICTGLILSTVLYRHGPFYSTVPAWSFLQNCTGMVLSIVLYRPDPFYSTVPAWSFLQYSTVHNCTVLYCTGIRSATFYWLYFNNSYKLFSNIEILKWNRQNKDD